MPNAFIINAHQPYPISEGKLNQSLVDIAKANLAEKGYEIQTTTITDAYDVDREIEKHV